MSDHFSDSQLDDQIRDVRIPDGLLANLRRNRCGDVLEWTDGQLDTAVCDVPVPPGLLDRLCAIPSDVALDQRIRDVEVPWSLDIQLVHRRIARRRPTLSRLAVAALIFIAVSAAYYLGVASVFVGLRPEPVAQTYLDVAYDGPLDIRATPQVTLRLAVGRVNSLDDSPPQPEIDIVSPTAVSRLVASGPAGQLIEEIERGLPLEADIFLVSYGPLGYPHRTGDKLPRFEEPPPPPRGGVEPPLVRPFNRRFLLKYGVNPPVFPAADASLQTSIAPLSTSSLSFDRSMRRLRERRLPSIDEVLVEDFLAASVAGRAQENIRQVDRETLRLELSGAASVFGEHRGRTVVKDLGWQPGAAHLLQVSAVTGRVPRSGRPVQLTVALDVSSSMRWDGRLSTAQAAIRHVVRELGPRDRVSVLAFNERAEQWIEGIDRDSRSELDAFLDSLRADGGTNLPRALQEALSTTLGAAADRDADPVLVLMTDGRASMNQQTLSRLRQMFEVASAHGLRFYLIEMNEPYDADPQLEVLRRLLKGDKRTATDTQAVKRAILEGFLGRDTLVAMDARLTVRFDPQAVLAYRLIGHNAAAGAGLIPVDAATNLHAGESATCLYEVWFRPGGQGRVAEAELEWHDTAAGRTRRRRQGIDRRQFHAPFLAAPATLQAAAIAAETAETLSGSPLSESRGRSLAHVVQVTERMSSHATSQEGLGKLIQFVELAERVRKERLAPRMRE